MTAENIPPPVPATAEAARFPLNPGRRRPAVPSMRRPITDGGFKTRWRRHVRDAGIAEGFRRHDTRHTAGTRYVRATGNLKGAQRLLGHARIETTTRYAHVLLEDIRAGQGQSRRPASSQREMPGSAPRAS